MVRLGKTPISCTPCAKRKVRCDRLQPCCHCKRRPQDNCVYPEPTTASAAHDHRLADDASARIEKLERYIRSLGGDPEQAGRSGQRTAEESPGSQNTGASSSSSSQPGSKRIPFHPKTSGLVTHNEEVTYIERYYRT